MADFYISGNGHTNPTDTTHAFTKGARNKGVLIFQNTKATGFVRDESRIKGVKTADTEIACENMVICGGSEPVAQPWGREGIPREWENTGLPKDWDQLEIFLECALQRFPAISATPR